MKKKKRQRKQRKQSKKKGDESREKKSCERHGGAYKNHESSEKKCLGKIVKVAEKFRLVRRKTPPHKAQSYIMKNNKWLYQIGVARCADHEEIMRSLLALLRSGHVKASKDACEKYVLENSLDGEDME